MRPFEFLPQPMPAAYDPAEKDPDFFYKNFMKPFIKDMIDMMDVGMFIDQQAVEQLRITIDDVLQTVEDRLEASPIIKKYQNSRLPAAQKAHAEAATQALRTLDYYLKEYNPSNIQHRTWLVNHFLDSIGKSKDKTESWTVSALKKYNVFLQNSFIERIIYKKLTPDHPHVEAAMLDLAKYKLDLWNRPRLEKAETPVDPEPFNAGSSKQKKELMEMLGFPVLATSKDTGEASWGREQLEELQAMGQLPEIDNVLQALIDHSYSAIIKNNFLKAFDSFTIDGVLHGNIRLFGAKSCRNTSNSPNLLNMPSTRSIYAEPLKRCFTAPEGFVIYAIDLSALEDRVIANLSGDVNKQNVFLQNLDGHSLNACGYFPEQVAEVMGPNTDNVAYVKEFYRRTEEEGDKILKKLRFDSKAPTFKLAYGGYPDADKGGTITKDLFDNYHNVLYPGITRYREQYVLPSAQRNGYIHLGLGCRMYSSKPEEQIRTLNNGTVQFWSILTLIAINELNYCKEQDGFQNDVHVCSTIYDSIYMYVRKDPRVIQWTNNNIVRILTADYLENQAIPNEAVGEIGNNWAELHKLKNNATLEEIEEVLQLL